MPKTDYEFDGLSRLKQVTVSSTTVSYGYDPDGNRVKQGTNGVDTWYVFDGLSVVMELDTSNRPTTVFTPGICKTRLDLAEPLTEYFLVDGLGSVVQLTDRIGNPTQEYLFDPFGATRNVNSDPFNRYRFVGLAQDDTTGLTYMNARWYDPTLGRFLSRDADLGAMLLSQTLNRYVYVDNNPLSRTDISGLKWWDPLGLFGDDEESSSKKAKGDAKKGEDTSDNSTKEGSKSTGEKDRMITCKGKARVLKGNSKLVGRKGGFPPTRVAAGSAVVDPDQWGGHGKLTAKYRAQVSGEAGGNKFTGITDVIGGASPIEGTNVREALRDIYTHDNQTPVIIELPSAEKDAGTVDITLRVPAKLGCPQGTAEVK